VRGDRSQEPDETFALDLLSPVGATLGSARAIGTIRNDDRIGTQRRDLIIGSEEADFLDGGARADTLRGGGGADRFGFRHGQSRFGNPDRLTDFRFGEDRIEIFRNGDNNSSLPKNFSRAANNRQARRLPQLARAVFADANGARRGQQRLGANAAALVRATHPAIAGTYLLINDDNASFNPRNDLLINLSGFRGRRPGLGELPVESVFG
jgi:Ca2+-binding RTX toxin-like protein